MSAEVINFGCRLNIAEGEAIRAATAGHDDLIVINSCAVTAEAERQARQAIRRVARDRPDMRIAVTGCAAQIDPGKWAALDGVDAVVGNREKRFAHAYAPRINATFPDIFQTDTAFIPVVSGPSRARAFVEIQTGCDHRCTFCIIPFGRGNSNSAHPDAIVAALRLAIDRGQREAILTGVDLTSYSGGLAPLLRHILDQLPDLPRLRLSSLDPAEIDTPLFDLLTSEPRLMPHVHLSLQAGDDMILKRMKRRHARSQAIDLVARLKTARPAIAIGADIIAGFPTENDAMFINSLALIDDCNIVFGHIFPYSPRDGTPGARMPQVSPQIARDRAATLRRKVAHAKSAWLDGLMGSFQKILVERDGISGHAENFASVSMAPAPPGSIQMRVITGREGDRLIA